ncbi:MAG: NAD-dependent epimerase/dehydratase family protein [Myxococcales bacterium]|nr:MAG: NAD-dependent epimerase/dehydratase family protein [Myxococcales bacterium]
MRVLVTGGAGFIASHVADKLIAEGHRVAVLDNLITGRRSNAPPEARFFEMDIRDPAIAGLWAAERFEALVHAAAQMDVRKSVDDPRFDADVNLLGLINLMEAGRRHGLKRVVFTSTGGAAYDDTVPFPTSEAVWPRPVSPYGVAKMASEMYLYYYQSEYAVPALSLRFGNVYGPRQNPHGEAGVVAIFARRLLAGQACTINGDGKQTRDYVFVADVARAAVAALESEATGSFNVSTGVETDVVALYESIREAVGVSMAAAHGPAKSGEVRRSCLDNRKIKTALGWTPQAAVADGVARTVEFFRRQLSDPDAR